MSSSATPDVAIGIRGVSRTFQTASGPVHALKDISLDVAKGEFVSLLGPSGCGKSTLLNMVAGLDRPSAGSVAVAGRPVTGAPDGIGMMFQNPVLLAWRNVLRNVLLPVEISGGARAARAAEPYARELLATVGLQDFEKKLPAELSGGMQQRAAICRMLVSEPEVLLLDEPFSALDEITREKMNLEIGRITEGGERAALFVTHNIQEAVFLADRVVVMSARPGLIAGIIEVDLPRPRSPEIVTGPAFQDLVRQSRRLLNLGAADPADPGAPDAPADPADPGASDDSAATAVTRETK